MTKSYTADKLVQQHYTQIYHNELIWYNNSLSKTSQS